MKQQLEADFSQEKVDLSEQHEAALGRQRKQLQEAHSSEIQELVQQHEEVMAEAKGMTAKRDRDQKQFNFRVRGHETLELSGSVPSQIFESEPDSVLNKTYNGEWAYARDDKGRACINSDPAHWPLIMKWLSFGTVPSLSTCTSDFISECTYWQLDNLLEAIEQLRAADQKQQSSNAKHANTDEQSIQLSQLENGQEGFKMEGHIHNFSQRFAKTHVVAIEFAAYGASWKLEVNQKGAFLELMAGLPQKQAGYKIWFGEGANLWQFHQHNGRDFMADGSGWGKHWPSGDKAERIQHCPFVDLQGSLLVTVLVNFP